MKTFRLSTFGSIREAYSAGVWGERIKRYFCQMLVKPLIKVYRHQLHILHVCHNAPLEILIFSAFKNCLPN